ncbi:MAG: hypothetical protein R3253_08630 [Longimicrobiales bacterium]|nr:hypothetical protein [Longimicrobiales bacterium]
MERVTRHGTRRSWGLALAVALVGAVVPSAAASQETVFDVPDQPWVAGEVEVPAVADTFALVRIERYPDLSLGVGLHYGTPFYGNIDLSIYVYPPRPNASRPAETEFHQAVSDVREYASRQEWTVDVRRQEPFTLETPAGTSFEGFVAEAVYTQGRDSARTWVYVFEKEELILKYRITYAEGGAPPDLDERILRWVAQTAEGITRYQG